MAMFSPQSTVYLTSLVTGDQVSADLSSKSSSVNATCSSSKNAGDQVSNGPSSKLPPVDELILMLQSNQDDDSFNDLVFEYHEIPSCVGIYVMKNKVNLGFSCVVGRISCVLF